MNNRVHFSSKKGDWGTPWELFHKLNRKHGPCTLDVCATPFNAKVRNFITPAENSLRPEVPWNGVCWMNPPYGRVIARWLAKVYDEVKSGRASKVVCLLPSRTDTTWFHDFVLPHSNIEFIRGRVKFEGADNSAPFPSLVAVFTKRSVTNDS